MPNLNRGSKTYRNLKDAFAIQSEASCRYLLNYARQADIEDYPDVGGLFRDRAEAEMDHAHGHLDYLKAVSDPATESPIGSWQGSQCRGRRDTGCAPPPGAHSPLATCRGVLPGVQGASGGAGQGLAGVCRAGVRGLPPVRPP